MSESKSVPSDFLVKYKNDTLNLKHFLHKHPGGISTLAGLRNRDVSEIMSADPVHSQAAYYLMQEYKVKQDVNNNNVVQKSNHSKAAAGYATPTRERFLDNHSNGFHRDKDYSSADNGEDQIKPTAAAASISDCDDDRLEVSVWIRRKITNYSH